ncbi:MAG: hypothetical protein HY767_00125, partial [Candidatus Omnitrophica bacterium]|nr:hypothetical protein [Candidatus Omnitrophota bacterium]
NVNQTATDGPEMTFMQTGRMSHQAALEVAGQITDPAKRAEALASIANDPNASITMAQTGAGDPVWQWTSSADPNISFSITFDHSVPVGLDNAPTGTELTFSRNVRVSRKEVTAKLALIPDQTLRDQELARLGACANCVFFNRQESIQGDPDASYHWSALGDSNNSYSLSLNSRVSVGIPVNGVYPSAKTEATFSANKRVSRTVVAGYINNDAEGEWISNPEDRAAALAAIRSFSGAWRAIRT